MHDVLQNPRSVLAYAALLLSVNFLCSCNAQATTETKASLGQLIAILQTLPIQKQLQLTSEQIEKIADLNQPSGVGTFSKAIAPLEIVLTAKQLIEFKRIAFPGFMVRAFGIFEVRDSLELTSDQLTAIAAIQAKLKTQLQPFQDKINQDASLMKNVDDVMQLERDTASFHENAYVEALELLTPEQREKWSQISEPMHLPPKNAG